MSSVPERLRPLIAPVLKRLVDGDLEGLKRDGIDPYPDADLMLWVREYGTDGAQLVEQPPAIWTHRDTYVIALDHGQGWAIDLPLWTTSEQPSDLTLSLSVLTDDGGYRVRIDELHVQ